MDQKIDKKKIMSELEKVFDPEIGCSIVDLGLIYDVRLNNNEVEVDMTLTTPECPLGETMIEEVEEKLRKIKGLTNSRVNLVFDPPWTPGKISPSLKKKLSI